MKDKGVLGGDDCLPLGPAKKIEPAPARAPRRGAPATPPSFVVVGPDGKMRTNGYVPKLAAAALVLTCCASFGAAFVEAQTTEGWITLHDEVGLCAPVARRAEWQANDGRPVLLGCWRPIEGGVAIAWFDGDASRVPIAAFGKVKPL